MLRLAVLTSKLDSILMAYRHRLFVALLSFLLHIARHAREACTRPLLLRSLGPSNGRSPPKVGGLEMEWEGAACLEWLSADGGMEGKRYGRMFCVVHINFCAEVVLVLRLVPVHSWCALAAVYIA